MHDHQQSPSKHSPKGAKSFGNEAPRSVASGPSNRAARGREVALSIGILAHLAHNFHFTHPFQLPPRRVLYGNRKDKVTAVLFPTLLCALPLYYFGIAPGHYLVGACRVQSLREGKIQF